MIPFLLPIVLVLYGEFSKGPDTRFTSRVLFYTYTLSILLPLYVPSEIFGLIVAIAIVVLGMGHAIINTKFIAGRFFILTAMLTALGNYTSLYLHDYTFLLSIPYYADYSHVIFRESLFLGITSISVCERLESKDFKLEMFITAFWIYEHLFI